MKERFRKLKNRAILVLFGAFLVWYGLAKLHHYGVFPYPNWIRQPVFPAGVVTLGILLIALGLFFSGEWVYRLFKSRRPQPHVLRKANRHYD